MRWSPWTAALCVAWCLRVQALPSAVRLSSTSAESVVQNAVGEYEADGETNGAIRYKRLATAQPQAGDRYLFRSRMGRWSVAPSQVDVAASKRIAIMSADATAASPLGLGYRFYSGEGNWEADSTLSVVDVSDAVAERRKKHAEYAQQLEASKSFNARARLEKQQAELAAAAEEAATLAAERAARELAILAAAQTKQAELDEEAAELFEVEEALRSSRQAKLDALAAAAAAAAAAAKKVEDDRLAALEAAAAAERNRVADEVARKQAMVVAAAAMAKAERLALERAAEEAAEAANVAEAEARQAVLLLAERRARAREEAARVARELEERAEKEAAMEAQVCSVLQTALSRLWFWLVAQTILRAWYFQFRALRARKLSFILPPRALVSSPPPPLARVVCGTQLLLADAAALEAELNRKTAAAVAAAEVAQAMAAKRAGHAAKVLHEAAALTARAAGGDSGGNGGGGRGRGSGGGGNRGCGSGSNGSNGSEGLAAHEQQQKQPPPKLQPHKSPAQEKPQSPPPSPPLPQSLPAAFKDEDEGEADEPFGRRGRRVGPAQALRVVSKATEAAAVVVHEATGDYVRDGDAHGYPRYRLLAPAAGPRFLFRSDKGRWTITGSEGNVARSKGTIVSVEVGESPVGLVFHYYAAKGLWPKDPTFAVLDTFLVSPLGMCGGEDEPDL